MGLTYTRVSPDAAGDAGIDTASRGPETRSIRR